MNYKEIDKRYSTLAESNCCLSCGGAINYSGASEGEICVDLGSGRGTDVMRLANCRPVKELLELGFSAYFESDSA
jgi:arsenite methyltransferase